MIVITPSPWRVLTTHTATAQTPRNQRILSETHWYYCYLGREHRAPVLQGVRKVVPNHHPGHEQVIYLRVPAL